jgi:aspartyl/asparaginyl beta-hydroxylase (cupin superfamily)
MIQNVLLKSMAKATTGKTGEAVMFDETFIHHAANRTDHQRVVLFCDVERPLWTAPARWFNRLFAKYVMSSAPRRILRVRVLVF